ncbi:MAG TPA: right-handed parallel beta-helix repeat-containing protein [Candidatus Binatia bacterium]
MNYFQAYLPSLDEAIVAAWDSQVAAAAETPWLSKALATQSTDLFPRFAACYAQLRALPRGARRALQRRLARSEELAESFPEWLRGQTGHALQQKLARSLAGAALLLALGQSAQAAVINVALNKTGVKADSQCSLIEAIVNANDDAATHADCTAGSGADDIVLTAGSVHTLTKINNSTYGATGLPVITTPITITGNGGRIRRKIIGTPGFRIFAVSNTGDLTLDNVTVSGGRKLSIKGGGVYTLGVVTINNSTITGNRAEYGGGVYNSYGELIITGGSTITNNKAGSGGGVATDNGTLTINNSTISNNTATSALGYGDGGGVFSKANQASYPTSIVGSTITGNRARFGGGVYALNTGLGSEVTIDGGTISQNTAFLSGGGIYHYDGSVAIMNSHVLTENHAKYGGGIYNRSGQLSIDNSTVSDNRATGRTLSSGGGIYNYPNATLLVTNSTISGNTSRYGGGVRNAGYFYMDATGTITTNTAIISGGGVYNSGAATFNYTSGTVYGNTPDDIYP